MHEVREFAGHADIRTTEVYFVRKEEDAEVAARRIHIRVTGRKGADTESSRNVPLPLGSKLILRKPHRDSARKSWTPYESTTAG